MTQGEDLKIGTGYLNETFWVPETKIILRQLNRDGISIQDVVGLKDLDELENKIKKYIQQALQTTSELMLRHVLSQRATQCLPKI